MLSRIAESLFWIGRYVERADDTARILDAFLARLMEDPWADEDRSGRALLAILGAKPPTDARLTTAAILEALAFDAKSAGAIAGAMTAARDNARGARETISSEMWECLNVTWHSLAARRLAADRLGPAVYLAFVRERAAVFTGLAESTMSHDDGWRFLVLGRSLERVDMTARLLSIQADAPSEHPGWRTVLRACGADESFVRTYGGAVRADLVVQFLLHDRLFPRSALHALTTAERCLLELDPSPERSGVTDAARRPVGQVRTRLEYADASGLLADLTVHLRALERACATASAAVTARYFPDSAPVTWEHEEV
jgi:uncharacterized alpha-E superfamily protein